MKLTTCDVGETTIPLTQVDVAIGAGRDPVKYICSVVHACRCMSMRGNDTTRVR